MKPEQLPLRAYSGCRVFSEVNTLIQPLAVFHHKWMRGNELNLVKGTHIRVEIEEVTSERQFFALNGEDGGVSGGLLNP